MVTVIFPNKYSGDVHSVLDVIGFKGGKMMCFFLMLILQNAADL